MKFQQAEDLQAEMVVAGACKPGADFGILLGIGSQPESVIIKGQNFEQMKNLADDIRSYIDDLETIDNVNINVQDNTPEVQLHFDMDYIGRNNFTLANLAGCPFNISEGNILQEPHSSRVPKAMI